MTTTAKTKTTKKAPVKKTAKPKTKTQVFKVTGEKTLKKVKELIKEGNVRKVTIKNRSGKTVAEFPLTFGVVGAVLAPVLAAIGAIVALTSDCSISVERE